MSSLAAKYDYLEKLTRKVCHSQTDQPRHKPYVPFRGRGGSDGGGDEGGPPKKKQKKKQKPTKGNNLNTNDKKPAPKTIQKAAQKQTITEQKAPQNGHQVQKKTEGTRSEGEFNAVDILRKRLHQKIEESRGQGPPKDPSSEEVQKRRAKRKQERERKKRKRKEFRMKKLAQSASTVAEEESKPAVVLTPQSNCAETKTAKKDTSTIVFNKVEVEADYVDKGTKLREKKKKRNVKGTLTPLVGRNYKQLLTRVEARKARLEELREKDEEKAKKEEEKMKWTNMLYKAEGMKIKDNEQLLRASLKRKEKSKAQRKKKWTERSQLVVEKMQQRQDKRRRNIQKRKDSKMDKRKQRARKKGRVLPEDLKKAAL